MNLSAIRLDTNLITAPQWGGGTYRTSGSHLALHHPRRVIVCSTKSVTPSPPAAVAEQTSEKVNRIGSLSQVSSVLGCQWGDEGKGKLVDILAKHFDIVSRCQGGANAGHTIYNAEGKKFALHLVPSGILNEDTLCVVGNGLVVHLPGLFKEIDSLESNGVSCKGRILISDRAHLLFDFHQVVDGLREAELAKSFVGTTKRGIGPCYSSKVIRNGIRVCDLRHMDTFPQKLDLLLSDAASRFLGFSYTPDMLKEEVERCKRFAERLEPFITDTVHIMNKSISEKKKILVEGGQATMLDIDFGTYPFVTSSSPSAGGICTGLGIAPRVRGDIVGVVKAYTTRVGSGPFPTEILGKGGDLLRFAGQEFGTTAGRPRRCGWLDVVALKFCCQINGFSSLNLTKLDVLSDLPEIELGVSYKYIDGMPIESFPGDLRVLEQSKEAEISASINTGATRNLDTAQKRGSTILNLKCVDAQTGLMGKTLLELQSNKGDVLPAHKAQVIEKASSKFIQEELKMDNVYDYMFHLLNEYAKLLKFKPKIPEKAVEICSELMACNTNGTAKKFKVESLVKGPSVTSPCNMPPPYDMQEPRKFL